MMESATCINLLNLHQRKMEQMKKLKDTWNEMSTGIPENTKTNKYKISSRRFVHCIFIKFCYKKKMLK